MRYNNFEDLQQNIIHTINNIDGRIIAKSKTSSYKRAQEIYEVMMSAD